MQYAKRLMASVGAAVLVSLPAAAQAGVYADDLTRCLVKSTTSGDKNMLVQWIFATMALHPEVAPLSAVSAAKRDEVNLAAAKLFETLLTERCLKETQQALKNEGKGTIEAAFNMLGQVAARELFGSPAVAAGMGEFAKKLDNKKLEKAFPNIK